MSHLRYCWATSSSPAPGRPRCQLIEVYEETGVGAIAVEKIPPEKTHLYGIIDGVPADTRWEQNLLRVRDMVEKPPASEAPSNLAVTGRYVLPPEVFDCLARTKPGRGGEIQLTDALRMLAVEHGLFGLIYEGQSYDAGDKLGFLTATVELALKTRSSATSSNVIIYGNNLTNKIAQDASFGLGVNNPGPGQVIDPVVSYIPPRVYGIELRYRFH